MPEGAILADALAPLRADPRRTAILLDVDGTLAPIVRHADEAQVPEKTRAVLVEVARGYGVVACVSGRRAADARRMVGIGSISYLGAHGTELLGAGRTEPVLDPAVQEWVPRLRAFATETDFAPLDRLRVRREDKGAILAVHWRGAPDEGAAHTAVREVAGRAEAAGLTTHWGRKVLELRPPVRMDKGAGIVSLLADSDLDAALYAGDDNTDLDAFRGLVELRDAGRLGRIVRVGVASDEGPSRIVEEADVVVEGTDGVLDLLRSLVG